MSQSDKDADLSHAIKQLETLLDSQTGDGEPGGEKLPVLDEIVDTDAEGSDGTFEFELAESGTPFSSTTKPDPEQIRAVLDRIAGQMETELESVIGILKQNMLEEFRNELATVLNMDPQQLDTHTSRRDDQKS